MIRVTVGFPDELHAELERTAKANTRSFAAEVVHRLGGPAAKQARQIVQGAVADFVPAESPAGLAAAAGTLGPLHSIDPKGPPKKKRTAMCEHRIPPEAHCWKCDDE